METRPHLENDRPTLEELNEFFGHDRYAVEATGCKIVEGWRGHGVAEMPIQDIHLNAQGHVMGGAIFTLADFALALACNTGWGPSVTVSTDINYIASPRGAKITAVAECVKAGHRLSFYDITITDDEGQIVAKANVVVCNV